MKLPVRDIKKIAVFRALQLGDLLCAIPAVRALRKAYPDASITLLGLPWAEALLTRFPGYFDAFLHFPGYPGLPEQPYNEVIFNQFTEKMQEEKFDLLIQLQGNGTVVNRMLPSLGARYLAGFYNEESFVPSDLFMPYPEHLPEPLRHLRLMEYLGIPADGTELEFPLYPEDEAAADHLFLPVEPGRYVIIHPGSRGSWRQWPPQYFALMADYCIEKGYTALITGTDAEKDITTEVTKCMRHPSIDLTGKTNLGAAGVLIRNAFMLISNCTGVSHIASATRTPSVVISMDGEPERWAPLNKNLHKVIDWTKHPGLDQVLDAVNTLIHRNNKQKKLSLDRM
jgi:ADP-heptose:LPS heptosyltransferase